MIVLGAILPHPPILLPQIAKGREVHAQATRDAYDVVARRLRELDVQRVLLISTHGIVTLNRFHILSSDPAGNFERFGHGSLTFGHALDAELTETIVAAAEEDQRPLTRTATWEESDHSIGVPLTLLGDALPPSIAVISISFRSADDHLRFGQDDRPRPSRPARAHRDHRIGGRGASTQRRFAQRPTPARRGSAAPV